MRNLIKNLQVISLYGIIFVFSISQVAAINSTTDNKQLGKNYPGLVKSNLANVNLIQDNGQAIKPLLNFLDLFGIKHQGTVKSINAAMQEHFIRKPSLERWDVVDTEQDKKLRIPALRQLINMGFVNAIPHFQVSVDYFILFGATLPRVEKRFNDFLVQYNAGTLQCKNIVLLGGVRKLQPSEIQALKNTPGNTFETFLKKLKKRELDLTEADMIRFVWMTKANNNLKRNFQEYKNLYFVNSTDITEGTNQRPTTTTTVEAWLRDFLPTPGSCHANVEKPYGIRMEKVLRLALERYNRQLISPKNQFSISWNSPVADNNLLLAIYKDELARAFCEEYKLKKYLGIIKG